MISPENIRTAKKLLADCCGRGRPSPRQLAALLALPDPPPAYKLRDGSGVVFPMVGLQAFCAWALEQLGGTAAILVEQLHTDALSNYLDSLLPGR